MSREAMKYFINLFLLLCSFLQSATTGVAYEALRLTAKAAPTQPPPLAWRVQGALHARSGAPCTAP